MTDPRIRVLKIKTGVVKRLTKEKLCYEKESLIEQERVKKFENEGKDEADIKKQKEVVQESVAMISDSQRRLIKAFQELKDLLESEEDLKDLEEYTLAQEVLEAAKPQLPSFNAL